MPKEIRGGGRPPARGLSERDQLFEELEGRDDDRDLPEGWNRLLQELDDRATELDQALDVADETSAKLHLVSEFVEFAEANGLRSYLPDYFINIYGAFDELRQLRPDGRDQDGQPLSPEDNLNRKRKAGIRTLEGFTNLHRQLASGPLNKEGDLKMSDPENIRRMTYRPSFYVFQHLLRDLKNFDQNVAELKTRLYNDPDGREMLRLALGVDALPQEIQQLYRTLLNDWQKEKGDHQFSEAYKFIYCASDIKEATGIAPDIDPQVVNDRVKRELNDFLHSQPKGYLPQLTYKLEAMRTLFDWEPDEHEAATILAIAQQRLRPDSEARFFWPDVKRDLLLLWETTGIRPDVHDYLLDDIQEIANRLACVDRRREGGFEFAVEHMERDLSEMQLLCEPEVALSAEKKEKILEAFFSPCTRWDRSDHLSFSVCFATLSERIRMTKIPGISQADIPLAMRGICQGMLESLGHVQWRDLEARMLKMEKELAEVERAWEIPRTFNVEEVKKVLTNIVFSVIHFETWKTARPQVQAASKLFGQNPEFDGRRLQEEYARRLKETTRDIDDRLEQVAVLEALTGVEPKIQCTDEERWSLNLACIESLYPFVYFPRLQRLLMDPFDPMAYHTQMRSWVDLQLGGSAETKDSMRMTRLYAMKRLMGWGSIGIPPHIEGEHDTQKQVERLLNEGYSARFSSKFSEIALAANTDPVLDPPMVEALYWKMFHDVESRLRILDYEGIYGILGVPPSSEFLNELAKKVVLSQSVSDFFHFSRFVERCGGEMDWGGLLASTIVQHPETLETRPMQEALTTLPLAARTAVTSAIEQRPWLDFLFHADDPHGTAYVLGSLNGVCSIENSEDLQFLKAAMHDLGTNVSRELYPIYIKCSREGSFDHPPQRVRALIAEMYSDAVVDLQSDRAVAADRAANRFGVQADLRPAIIVARNRLIKDSRSWVKLKKFSAQLPKDPGASLRSALEQDPWMTAFQRIQGLQAIGQNLAYDPWDKQWTPLLNNLIYRRVLSVERDDDAQLLEGFVKRFGMENLPVMFCAFADCTRASTMDDLSDETIANVEGAGIKLRKSDGSWRFPSPLLVINELRVAERRFCKDLLDNRGNVFGDSELVEELLSKIMGSTQWRHYGDHAGAMLAMWKRTLEQSPSLDVIPSAYQETAFDVPMTASAKSTSLSEREREGQWQVFLESKEVADLYAPLARVLHEMMKVSNPSAWWKSCQEEIQIHLHERVRDLQLWLDATPETVGQWIADERDEEKKKMMTKRQRALENAKARQGMEKQIRDGLRQHDDVGRWPTEVSDPSALVSIMEAMVALESPSSEVSQALLSVSGLHAFMILPPGWQDRLRERLADSADPSMERFQVLAEFSRQFLNEHYLHPEQNPDHTGHASFSKALQSALRQHWQQQVDPKGRLPIETLVQKGQQVLGIETRRSSKTATVSMVPVTGLLRIYSGDIGDACFSSKHQNFAGGDYKNLQVWAYVTGRQEGIGQSIRGSFLGIETHDDRGVPTILGRANNPQENLISSVDADAFVLSSLREVVATARRKRNERMIAAEGLGRVEKGQCVVIPIDASSGSSTNRQSVSAVYHARWGTCSKVGLNQQEETAFNGYPNWNKHGAYPCAIIWEMDPEGREYWFGNWESKS